MKLSILLSLVCLSGWSQSLPPLPVTQTKPAFSFTSYRKIGLSIPMIKNITRNTTVISSGLRCVKLEYLRKEVYHNDYDVFRTSWEGLIVGHTYRLEWSRDLRVWIQLPQSSLTWIVYGITTMEDHPYQFSTPIASALDIVPISNGYFRLRDLSQ